MILYGLMDSPFVRRVAVTLEHYGLPYERRALSVFRDSEAMLAINPLGKAPALRLDDGELLFDSQMIIDYLDTRVAPETALTPPAGRERRDVLRVVTVALGLGEKSVGLNGELRRRAADKIDPAAVARHETQIASALTWLETTLRGPWMMGDAMTQADVTVVAGIGHLRNRHPALHTAAETPRLDDLVATAEELAPFKRAPFAEN